MKAKEKPIARECSTADQLKRVSVSDESGPKGGPSPTYIEAFFLCLCANPTVFNTKMCISTVGAFEVSGNKMKNMVKHKSNLGSLGFLTFTFLLYI